MPNPTQLNFFETKEIKKLFRTSKSRMKKRKKKRSKHSQKKRVKNRKWKDRKRKRMNDQKAIPTKPSLHIMKTFQENPHRIKRLIVFEETIVTSDTGGYLKLWEKDSGNYMKCVHLYEFEKFNKFMDIIKWNEEVFFTCSIDEKIRVFDRKSLEIIKTISSVHVQPNPPRIINQVLPVPHKNELVAIYSTSNLRIFSYESGESKKFAKHGELLGDIIRSKLSIVREDWLYSLCHIQTDIEEENPRHHVLLVRNFRTPDHPENSNYGCVKTFGNPNFRIQSDADFCVMSRNGQEIVVAPFRSIMEEVHILIFSSISKKRGSSFRHNHLLVTVPTNIDETTCLKGISNRYLCMSVRKLNPQWDKNSKLSNHGFLKLYDFGRGFNQVLYLGSGKKRSQKNKKKKSSGLKVYLERKVHERGINDFEIVEVNRMNLVRIYTCSNDKLMKVSEVRMELDFEDEKGKEWMEFDMKHRIQFFQGGKVEMEEMIYGSQRSNSDQRSLIQLKIGGALCLNIFKLFLLQ